jgi:hypothetical protein
MPAFGGAFQRRDAHILQFHRITYSRSYLCVSVEYRMLKLNIKDQPKWDEHRSGWKFVLRCLEGFHDESGPLFDGLVDRTFGFNATELQKNGRIPYNKEWLGFIHSSVSLCPFMANYVSLDSILSSPAFLTSLKSCVGIFTLSEYLAAYIRDRVPAPLTVVSLKHPTEFPAINFDINKFRQSKKVVHIGSWLRRITSFLKLNAGPIKRILLLNPATLKLMREEILFYNDYNFDLNDIEMWQHISDQEYDNLLGEAIVFIHLCDSSATNTIIECIARNTPILINRAKPMAEYLGDDYPYYYSCLEEANEKLGDEGLIQKTAEYLADFPGKRELTGDFFVDSFLRSSIIQDLMHRQR